jgi:lipopolysaccharide transport system ATP-binding protein
MEPIVEVEDVWKRFKIPHEKRTTILENIAGVLQILGGKTLTYEEFWALKAVNFSISHGESIGVIGENGSGKSTLLRVIANILRPDKGKVTVDGKIAPILALGVGFHPELSVKENIVVYGSIMGLRSAHMKERIDSVLQFANLERFQDARLKNLSSGMQVRLGFSVAVETNPDIFLVDEALAVGDMDFQKKCIAKFQEFKKEGKTIILVSHAMSLVKEFCEKTLLLSRGEMISFGETEKVVNEYLKRVQAT